MRLVAHLVILVVISALVVLVFLGVLHLILVLLGFGGVVDDLAACTATTRDDVLLGDGFEVVVILFFVCNCAFVSILDPVTQSNMAVG